MNENLEKKVATLEAEIQELPNNKPNNYVILGNSSIKKLTLSD